MTLIAFDQSGPEVGRLLKGVGNNAGRVSAALGTAALRAARRRPLEVALFGGLIATLVIVYALLVVDPPVEQEAARPAPVPTWVEVAKPLPMFGFVAPEVLHAPASYAMRRHTTGGGREDILTYGEFAGDGPYVKLVIHQVGGEGAPAQTLFVDVARRAAEAGLALDGLGLAAALPTRFGTADWADARLASPADGAVRENCSAFRFSEDRPALRVLGLACGARGEPYSRSQMSCLVGRLDLTAAGDDVELQKYFARSELARDAACPPARARAEGATRGSKRRPQVHAAMGR